MQAINNLEDQIWNEVSARLEIERKFTELMKIFQGQGQS